MIVVGLSIELMKRRFYKLSTTCYLLLSTCHFATRTFLPATCSRDANLLSDINVVGIDDAIVGR